jgi:3-dehydroquinate synthase
MQKSFEINSSLASYNVVIGKNLLTNVIAQNPDAVIICDDLLTDYVTNIKSNIIFITANEKTKDLDNISSIITKLKELKITKQHKIIAIGGGIIQDTSCFVASIYMRGIDWLYMPTTLLGMSDSCIGGKSSINAGGIKNIVGNFYPPKSVYVDTEFLTTLPNEQVLSGLFEAVKICFVHPDTTIFEQYFKLIEQNAPMGDLIYLSLKTKKWFIEIDEFDKKERQLLNFGHTFGHALESATNYAIPHGIAVGVGMIMACHTTNITYPNISQQGKTRIAKLISYCQQLLSQYKPINLTSEIIADSLVKYQADKKHTKESFACIMPDPNGLVEKKLFAKNNDSLDIIKNSFDQFMGITNDSN